MKYKISFYFLLFVLVCVLGGCTQKADTFNRSYFTFIPEDRKVIVPVQLNDSVSVKLGFDTGFGLGFYKMSIMLDSTVLAAHPDLFSDSIPVITSARSGWNKNSKQQSLTYNSNPKLRIGDVDLTYTSIELTNWRKLMNNDFYDGMFNVPKNDTTHIWELNFESNYMEIHPANDFIMPEDCFITPLIGPDDFPFYIDIPLQIRFADNDTLTINQIFLIDTGAAWDIVLLHKAPELKILNKREDAVWTEFLGDYIRHYTVDATLFDGFLMDSMRIYTIDYQNDIDCINYIIGLNFLKCK